jgi:hypothetical protein
LLEPTHINGGASAKQEAHMRQILKIKIALVLGVLGGIFVSVVTSPTKMVTHTDTDLMAIHGLQVRVPNGMKNFPMELIPLP